MKVELLSPSPPLLPSSSSGSLSPAPSSSQLDSQNQPPLSPPDFTDLNEQEEDFEATVLYFAVGKDMNPAYMRQFCPSAHIVDFARLDNYEYIIDHLIEEPCVLPCSYNETQTQTQNQDQTQNDNRENQNHNNESRKVVYGMLYEIDVESLFDMHAAWTGPNGEMMEIDRVDVMRMSVDRKLGWGVRRDLHEEGWVHNVSVFVGTLGEVYVGLGEGCNEEVNVGIVLGCLWGIPDRWVEENVRRWVNHPVRRLFW